MTTAHNHPPICCCQIPHGHAIADYRDGTPGPLDRCPLCPEHGELAQLAHSTIDGGMPPLLVPAPVAREPQPGECPICHSEIGKQHTDYCRLTGPVLSTDLPIMGVMTQTTQPATTTSQPTTQARSREDEAGIAPYRCGYCPHPTPCPWGECNPHRNAGAAPPRTPGYDGPEGTEWPRADLAHTHVWGQDTHYPPQRASHPISECTPDCQPPQPDDHPW